MDAVDRGTTDAGSVVQTLDDQLIQILEESEVPVDLKQIKTKLKQFYPKSTKKAPKPIMPADESLVLTLSKLIDAQQIFVHPPLKLNAKRYGLTAPLTPEQIVTDLVTATLQSGPQLFLVDKLAKQPKSLDKAIFQQTLQSVIQKLLAEHRLFEHPSKGKKKQYGLQPPPKPKWYETAKFKKPADAFIKAAAKLLPLGEVSLEDLIDYLRLKLSETSNVIPPSVTSSPEPVTPLTPSANKTAVPEPIAVVMDLRTALKKAYDYLCLFVEFRDKLVEIPRLYHETTKLIPSLKPEQFQAELWQMSSERKVELHVLNEVMHAVDPHLAISHDDQLYYYARWK